MKIVIAALIIALLSGMGVGSGGLLVTYLTLFEAAPQLTAQGLNLLFFLFASSSSLIVHGKKRKILLQVVLLMGAFGVAGSLLGSWIAPMLSGPILGKIFGAMLVLTGTLSLRRPKSAKKCK